jgi:hypothetical protein
MSDRYGGEPAAPSRPRPVLGAAVLALVQAGLLLALAVVVPAAALAGGSPAGEGGGAVLVCLAACSLAGLDLLGGLLLLRGGGRALLVAAAWAEVGLVGVLLLVGVVDAAVRRSADPLADLAGVLVVLTLLTLPVVRLAALSRPAVLAWCASRGSAVPTRLAVAALLPVAALAAAATVTLALAQGSRVIAEGSGVGYRGTGEPADPPAPGDAAYDPRFAGPAAQCRDGDMAACDELYFRTPLGDPYETYGSTCGGRLDEETSGGCVPVFGPTD